MSLGKKIFSKISQTHAQKLLKAGEENLVIISPEKKKTAESLSPHISLVSTFETDETNSKKGLRRVIPLRSYLFKHWISVCLLNIEI